MVLFVTNNNSSSSSNNSIHDVDEEVAGGGGGGGGGFVGLIWQRVANGLHDAYSSPPSLISHSIHAASCFLINLLFSNNNNNHNNKNTDDTSSPELQSLRSGSQTLNTRKYVMQSAEFYGADFSNTHSVNLVLQKELVEVAAQHKITSDAAALDSVNHTCISDGAERRAVQGTVFLEALNRLAQTTSSSNSSPATQLHLG